MGGEPAGTIILRDEAGIRAAADVLRALGGALGRHRHVTVGTEAITGADITTVQTLLAARRQARARGGEVVLSVPLGKALVAVLDAGGFLVPGQEDAGFWPMEEAVCLPAGHGAAA